MRSFGGALSALALALVLGLLVGGARSATSPSGLIAFARSDGIYTMGSDGRGVRPLVRGLEGAGGLEWSPDGRKLAFVAMRSDLLDFAIWVVDADGENLTRLGTRPAGRRPMSPTWSRDGHEIAFTAFRTASRSTDIWTVQVDGRGLRRLTRTPARDELQVDWSPSGQRLAVVGDGYDPSLWVVDANGRNARDLGAPGRPAELRFEPLDPDWSPDGRRIAVADWRLARFSALHLVNPNTGTWARITDERFRDHGPAWSPDGRYVAFVRGGDGVESEGLIHVMRADGSGVTRLARGGSPAWQPVGRP